MATREDNSTPDLNESRNSSIPRQDDLSADRNRTSDEDELDTRNVSSDVEEEGEEDLDDEELDDDDFETDDEDADDDTEEDVN